MACHGQVTCRNKKLTRRQVAPDAVLVGPMVQEEGNPLLSAYSEYPMHRNRGTPRASATTSVGPHTMCLTTGDNALISRLWTTRNTLRSSRVNAAESPASVVCESRSTMFSITLLLE